MGLGDFFQSAFKGASDNQEDRSGDANSIAGIKKSTIAAGGEMDSPGGGKYRILGGKLWHFTADEVAKEQQESAIAEEMKRKNAQAKAEEQGVQGILSGYDQLQKDKTEAKNWNDKTSQLTFSPEAQEPQELADNVPRFDLSTGTSYGPYGAEAAEQLSFEKQVQASDTVKNIQDSQAQQEKGKALLSQNRLGMLGSLGAYKYGNNPVIQGLVKNEAGLDASDEEKTRMQTVRENAASIADPLFQQRFKSETTAKGMEDALNDWYTKTMDHDRALELARINADASKNKSDLNIGQKQDQRTEDRFTLFNKYINPSNAPVRSALGVANIGYERAERLETLGKAFKDGNKLRDAEIEELAIGMNSMLVGGAMGSRSQVEALVPKSVIGNSAKLWQWVSNNPQGMQQGEFVKRILGSIIREKDTMYDQIQRAQFQRVNAYKDLEEKDQEWFNSTLMDNGIDPEKYAEWKKNASPRISAVQKPEEEKASSTSTYKPSSSVEAAKKKYNLNY